MDEDNKYYIPAAFGIGVVPTDVMTGLLVGLVVG